MFKLYRRLSIKDVIFVILIIGLTVLSVFCTMQLVDYIQNIITSITYVNYHNHPELISNELKLAVDASGWEAVKVMMAASPMAEIVNSVADASQADIWFNGGIILAYAAGSMVVQGVIAVLASFVAADLTTKVRCELYEKIEGFSLAEIDRFSTASLITRSTNDLQQIQMANLMTMRMIFQAPVTAIWALVKFSNASSELSVATIIGIFIIVSVVGVMMVVVLPKFRKMQSLTDNINRVTRDNLTGIRIVRAYNAEKYEEENFAKANNEFTNTQLFTGMAMNLLSPVIMIVMNGLSLAMYIIGANLINSGVLYYSQVVASVMLSSQIIMSFMMILMLFIMWPRAVVGAGRINEVLDTLPSVVDPKEAKPFVDEGTIEFKNVSFRYPHQEGNALEDISFKVNKGETLAIIGATSSGKSSLVNLISRLYDATSGEVLIDGVNVCDVNQHDLRGRVGFVPQKGFLFSGTIKENICFGEETYDEDRMKFAASVSCAEEFIEGKNEKYDFMITQGGKNVSGGQRQRLCIARAVYKKPEIYVFDDSFSALDYQTDKKLRENLNNLNKGATKVIVAQRIGTIMDADKIIVLDEGKMVGIGTHDELLKSCEIYKEIALSQLSEKELGLNAA